MDYSELFRGRNHTKGTSCFYKNDLKEKIRVLDLVPKRFLSSDIVYESYFNLQEVFILR